MDGSGSRFDFLDLLRPHEGCDVILVCPPSLVSRSGQLEKFYCHREALAGCCQAIASMRSFACLASVSTPAEFFVPASADIVYEILRYVYRGMLQPWPKFRERFGEFLVAIDYLCFCSEEPSIDDLLKERVWELPLKTNGSIFGALCLQELLEGISNEEIREALCCGKGEFVTSSSQTKREWFDTTGSDSGMMPERCHVGIETRQMLFAKVAELRLRASGGPPPSDPMVIFKRFLDRFKSPEVLALEADGWTIEDDSMRIRRRRSI
eukprot:TRINITY_DN2385_c0_g1_i7.p1 TRINITY_DN2385_c0_g1~~TRINITY_DN2385_c0_g1_i7.p1  ORF type:complete len:266 (+),score=36.33 TRINITY_DN2385_c0_g1_i7:175-972(+)